MTDGKDTAFEFRFLATSTMDSKRTIKWGGNALLAMIHLTVVGDKVVYASEELSNFAPSPLPVSPEWSPVKLYGGYARSRGARSEQSSARTSETSAASFNHALHHNPCNPWWFGCGCFA